MAPRARTIAQVLAIPRDPLQRTDWLARVLGPALVLPAAALAAGWLVQPVLAACTASVAERCRPLASFMLVAPVLLAVALALGLLLGLVAAARRRRQWPARLASIMAASLPLATTLLAPELLPGSLPLAAVIGLLAGAGVVVPRGLTHQVLALVHQERRRWWAAALRAARLTRRTLGLGVYRELCSTGHIRVASTLYPARVYLVPRRTSPSGARVLVQEHGRTIGGLCLRPREPLPDPEEVVAHVLLLRGDERAYLSAANFFPYDTTLTHQATARRL